MQVHAGDWIVRLDQPYAATPRTLLAIQHFKADDPPPYDDTGWTLDELRHVQTLKIADSTILARPMQLLTRDAHVEGDRCHRSGPSPRSSPRRLALGGLPWKVAPATVSVAEDAFTVGGVKYPAGTYIINKPGDATRNAVEIARPERRGARRSGECAPAFDQAPAHRADAFVARDAERGMGALRVRPDGCAVQVHQRSIAAHAGTGSTTFDVVVFPHVSGSPTSLINGRPMVGPPIPWKKSALTPNLDRWDQTDDIRPGMGLDGAAALQAFRRARRIADDLWQLERPADHARLQSDGDQATTTKFNARGSVIRVQPAPGSANAVRYYMDTRARAFRSISARRPCSTSRLGTRWSASIRDPAFAQQQERMRARDDSEVSRQGGFAARIRAYRRRRRARG